MRRLRFCSSPDQYLFLFLLLLWDIQLEQARFFLSNLTEVTYAMQTFTEGSLLKEHYTNKTLQAHIYALTAQRRRY